MVPRLTKKPWFGPRRLPGWGWSPVTWQGWLVIVVFLAAIAGCAFLLPGVVLRLIAEAVLVLLLLAVCLLTGTRPTSG
jgi:hypothetical protein